MSDEPNKPRPVKNWVDAFQTLCVTIMLCFFFWCIMKGCTAYAENKNVEQQEAKP